MSEYQRIRDDVHRLLGTGQLIERRLQTIEAIEMGEVFGVNDLLPGMCGVSTYWRKDKTKICERSLKDGAADGCTRYYDEKENMVGEDYFVDGEVVMTRIFSADEP